jgi:tripartite-type tricarboxylate transporter receptor subunit TctC
VTSAKRSTAAPDIPAIAETPGLSNYDAAQWQGLVAPAGTPSEVVLLINTALNRALQLPDVKERFGALGVELSPTSPQELNRDVKADLVKWGKLIKSLGLSLD